MPTWRSSTSRAPARRSPASTGCRPATCWCWRTARCTSSATGASSPTPRPPSPAAARRSGSSWCARRWAPRCAAASSPTCRWAPCSPAGSTRRWWWRSPRRHRASLCAPSRSASATRATTSGRTPARWRSATAPGTRRSSLSPTPTPCCHVSPGRSTSRSATRPRCRRCSSASWRGRASPSRSAATAATRRLPATSATWQCSWPDTCRRGRLAPPRPPFACCQPRARSGARPCSARRASWTSLPRRAPSATAG